MSITRSTLKTGPAIVRYQGETIYFKSGLTITESKETFDVASDAFGPVDLRLKDIAVKISGTPVGEWEALTVLFPYLSSQIGTRIHGDTDKPLVIIALDGTRRTYHNAAITKMPSLKLAATETLLGNVEWTARCKDNTEPSAAGSLFTLDTIADLTGVVAGATNATPIVITDVAHGLVTGDHVTVASVGGNTAANGTWIVTRVTADTFSLNGSVGANDYTSGGTWALAIPTLALSVAAIKTQPYSGAWGADPWDAFATTEGFAIDFALSLGDITADGYGILDQMVKSITAEAKFKPLVPQADIDTKLGLQGAASAMQGASLQASGESLVISATGVHITLYGAAAKSAGQLFQADALRTGELVAVATRTFAAGALNPVARIGTAAP
jgi:hypothetical protein